MTRCLVVGVDPGPIPGIVTLRWGAAGPMAVDVFQCSHTAAVWLVRELLTNEELLSDVTLLAVERFVVGPRAARSATPKAGQITRDLVGALTVPDEAWATVVRAAAEVFPWATDARLDAVGLLDATKGMQHARSAARHALFAAIRDLGHPDPLSRRTR